MVLNTVISREAWGGRLPRTEPVPHIPRMLVIHHSWRPTAKGWGGVRSMRAIQDYHMDTNGWADIGYHYVIAPDGMVLAGREPIHTGSHCGGPTTGKRVFGNCGTIGICCIGDYDTEQPSAELLTSLNALIADLCRVYGIAAIRGHFEATVPAPKTCPGEHLADGIGRLPQWQAAYPIR